MEPQSPNTNDQGPSSNPQAENSRLLASFLGRVPYDQARSLQHSLARALAQDRIPETVLALEHPPVITLGKRGKTDHIVASHVWLEQQGITVCETERGGDVTYHGPGQLVVYPVFRVGRAVRRHVTAMAQAAAQVLSELGIDAQWNDDRPGLWVGNDKIAAVGLAVQGGIAFHGLALNATVDLSGFAAIVPCGLTGTGVTSIDRLLGSSPSLDDLARRLITHLASQSGRPSPTFLQPTKFFAYLSQQNIRQNPRK